jgi:DNA-binding response OmpR family regulator
MGTRIALIEDSFETRRYLVNNIRDGQLYWTSTPPFFDDKVEAQIAAFDPDLIILDLQLDEDPESGFRVLRQLKSSKLEAIPVVVLSKFINRDDPDDRNKVKARRFGAALALSKIPFPEMEKILEPRRQREDNG